MNTIYFKAKNYFSGYFCLVEVRRKKEKQSKVKYNPTFLALSSSAVTTLDTKRVVSL